MRSLAVKLGKRYAPDRATIATYRVEFAEQREPIKQVREILSSGFDQSVVLFGSIGTGKDHLLAAILYGAAKAGKTVAWANGQEVYSRFRDAMDSKQSEESIMAGFVAPEVLGISDPIPPVVDPHKPAAWRTELLFRVLDNRYRDCKPTLMTLNARDPQDINDKLSPPVWDRLKDQAILIPCFWPSFRGNR